MTRTSPRPPDDRVPEEPDLVTLGNGVRHPPPIRAAAFLGLVRAGEALARRLDHDLQSRHGLSLRAYEVLLHLAAFSDDGRIRMSVLAEQAPLSQSRVSRLVAELEAKGLVARTTSPEDSRGVEVSLTDAGLRTLKAVQDTHHEGLRERLFDLLSWDEVVTLAQISGKVLDANR